MKHFVNRGNTIQLNWTLHSISGQEFALTGHTYKLFFATGNQSAQATGVTHSGNVLSWTFTPDAQWKLGSYTIWLEVYNNGTKIVTVAYPDAFHLAHEVASSGTTQTGTQTESTTLNLVSSCDFYRFAPVVPVAGEDGYWYVNGEKAVDGSGEYILTSHTLEYDEQTRNLIIDRGRVDSEGHSIEQVITALADLDSYYQAAEGSEAGSEAGDGSRWGSYKTAENARNTAAQNAEIDRQSAASAAEGSSAGSVAGDGSRWGEFKSAEAERETASETAIARANAAAAAAELMVNIHQGPPGDDGEDGTGIEEVEQTETSIANGGTNKVRITLTDGTYYDIQIKNGSSSAGLFPTSSALAAACPSPKVGDYAYVGDGFPADIYVCATAGTWTDSGEDYDGDEVDLTDYAKKAELTQLEHDLSDSLSAKFFSIGIINANCSWCSLGTSITWYNDNVNSSFTKGYQTRVREKVYFSSFTNKGINGGTMGSGNGVTGLGDSLSTIVSADLYTIEHGVNDWGHSIPIGTIDDYKNDTGTNTFFGAYRKVIDKIYQLNINAKIILCTPRKAYGFNGYLPLSWDSDKNGLYLKQYADAVLSIAEYESLPVCDWFNESGANQKTLDNYSIDTALHPNDAGYQMMADLLINTMRNMFNSDKMDCVYEAGENVVRVEPTLASGGTAYNNKNGTFIGPEMGVNKQTILSKILSSVDKTGVKVGICVVNPNNTPNVVSVYRYVTLSGTETDVSSLGIVVPAGCYVGFSNEIAQNPASSFSFVANSGTPHFQMYDDSVFQPSQFPTLKMTLGYELVY